MPRISRRQRRKMAVESLLRERDTAGVVALSEQEPNVISALVGLLNETDDLLRWRAIEAIGVLAARRAEEEGWIAVKDLVRRQIWTMGEESGGTAWHAAEALAEMIYNVQPLAEEFATVMASFGDSEPWEWPCAWGVARLANSPARQYLEGEVEQLLGNLTHEDPAVRGHSAVALGRLGDAAAIPALQGLVEDAGSFARYDFSSGELKQMTVGQAAVAALESLSA